ncbi:MAG: DEAD/DEAH box helicase family protein, partial [Thauera sp.]|nr:DEAD/DEAH box helicase family protein [Thauera sp.]
MNAPLHSALAGAGIISLRAYQSNVVDATRAALRAGKRRVLAYLPTGGGKTRVATAIAQLTLAKSTGRVIVLANRKQLVHQFAAAMRAAGLDVGIAQGENTAGLHHRVVVCSIDTIHARSYTFEDVALFIIDEAHAVAGSEKYRTLLFRYNRVPVIGLSAT